MIPEAGVGSILENFHLAYLTDSESFKFPITESKEVMVRHYSSQSTELDGVELNEKSLQNETDSV